MIMKRVGLFFVILLILTACSNDNVIDLSTYNFSDFEDEISKVTEIKEDVNEEDGIVIDEDLDLNLTNMNGNETLSNEDIDLVIDDIGKDVKDDDIVDTQEVLSEMNSDMLTYVEGDKIVLNPKVNDPDGDMVSIVYYDPFNKNGEWNTKLGDAGMHNINFTITDGDKSQNIEVQIFIEKKNRAPVVEDVGFIEVNEGEVVILDVKITDEENDDLNITYEGFMNSKEYETDFQDSGTYEQKIIIFDGINTVESSFDIIINDVNQAPEFTGKDRYNLKENETVELELSFEDIDEDSINYELPEELENEEFYAEIGSVGVKRFNVEYSDGEYNKTEELTFVIEDANFAPILLEVNDREYNENLVLTFKEGDNVLIDVLVDDYDDDKLKYSYKGLLNSNSKELDYDSSGEYSQKIIISDGTVSITYDFTIVVENVNRAPEFLGFE